MKVSMKLSRLLDSHVKIRKDDRLYQKVDTGSLYIESFDVSADYRYTIRYIDIESIFRYIEASLVVHVWCVEGRTTVSWIPSAVFIVVTFITGLMALLLPETLNRPLPETIEEIESWTRSLVPRGPRLTGDGSAQVQESGTTAGDDLQVVEESPQDVEDVDIKRQQSADV